MAEIIYAAALVLVSAGATPTVTSTLPNARRMSSCGRATGVARQTGATTACGWVPSRPGGGDLWRDPFRIHPSLSRQLTHEWAQLHSLTSTRTQVRRWGRNEPALTGFTRPGDIVDAIDAGDHDRKNELLLALIRLFQAGQQLAGRTVLQALLPRIGARPGLSTSSDTGPDDRRHIVLAEFWDVMSDYPIDRRPTRVAANLTLDTLHRVSGARRRRPDDIPVDPADFASNPSLDTALTASLSLDRGVETQALDAVDEDLRPDADLRQVITWGIHRNVITVDEAQLLTISYLPAVGRHTGATVSSSGCGFAAAAAELGCTQATVRQRCSRAARKLAAAVHAEAG
jgi:hypothetical protein